MSEASIAPPPGSLPPVSHFPMYYPHGYDHARARDLAALVDAAYVTCELEGSATLPAPAGVNGYEYVKAINGGYWPSLRDWILLVWYTIKTKRLPRNRPYFGFVARRGNDVVLVFRGTDSEGDVLSDIHMSQVLFYDEMRRRKPAPSSDFDAESAAEAAATARWNDARLEQGVWDIYKTLRVQVIEAVESCYAPGRRLFVTGHSLGAGLAIAALPDLIRNTRFKGDQRPEFYTFAGPRVVNREFAFAMLHENVNCYRVVHTEDIVPTAPSPIPVKWLEGWMKGRWYYTHVGTPVNFTLVYPPAVEVGIQTYHSLATYILALTASAADSRAPTPPPDGRTPELASRRQ